MSDPLRVSESTQAPYDGQEVYREQLARWARAMATGQVDEMSGALEKGTSLDRVHWFVDGNLEKRSDLLARLLPFVAEAFEQDEFEMLLRDYVSEQPLAAEGGGAQDAEAYLQWLEQTRILTPVQADYVACQRARHAVEEAARRKRIGHLHFQELRSVAESLADDLDSPSGSSRNTSPLQLHLNPARAWARFRTPALVGSNEDLPVDVLFFAVGSGVNTIVVTPTVRALLDELAQNSPWTLDSWSALSQHADRAGLIRVCRNLARVGLVAFG